MGFYDDYKLQASDYTGHDIESLPDVVSGQAATLKARFDSLVKDVVAARFNSFLSGLDAASLAKVETHNGTGAVSSLAASAHSTLIRITDLDSTKTYIITAWLEGKPSTSGSGGVSDFYLSTTESTSGVVAKTDMQVYGDIARKVCVSTIVTGTTAIYFRGWLTAQHGLNNITVGMKAITFK